MSKKGRISHDRVEALEKLVVELKDRVTKLENFYHVRKPPEAHLKDYVPQFDRWPGNER